MNAAFGTRLVAGTMTGYRVFRVDRYGRLFAPQYDHAVTRPGENHAECRNGPLYDQKHKAGSLECSCGFYAYFDPHLENHYYDRDSTLRAVISGYGRVTAGSDGFKCEKMKVVALIEPTVIELSSWDQRCARFDEWLDNRAGGVWFVWTLLLFGIASLASAVAWPIISKNFLTVLPGVFGTLLTVVTVAVGMHGESISKLIRDDTSRAIKGRAELCKKLYPDVEWYETIADAVEAHPPTAPEATMPSGQELWKLPYQP